jgi:hypothetical protein
MTPSALRIHLRQRLRRTGNAPYLLDASTLLQNALAQYAIVSKDGKLIRLEPTNNLSNTKVAEDQAD